VAMHAEDFVGVKSMRLIDDLWMFSRYLRLTQRMN